MLLLGYVFFSCTQRGPAPEKAIAGTLLVQVDSFAAACGRLQATAEGGMRGGVGRARGVEGEGGDSGVGGGRARGADEGVGVVDEKKLQRLFLAARLAYKRFEWAAEYFEPAASRSVNGAPVQEVELSGQVFEPAGLQVIEGYLFPQVDTARVQDLVRQLQKLQSACGKYKTHFGNIDIFDWQVFDAVKLEVFRIETLGITGFDDPLTQNSMEESAVSLESLRAAIARYPAAAGDQADADQADAAGDPGGRFDAAIRYLRSHPDFNTFDRAEYLTAYCNPLTVALSGLEDGLKIHVIRYNRLLNQDAKTLSDTDAFNVNAYSPDPASFMTPAKIALGKVLFSDPALSATGTRSCRSCHQPGKAFTDGLVKNTVLGGDRLLRRNTPTLLNAALQAAQFYDLRVNTLEDQSRMVVQNAEEMHGSMKLSVEQLWKDSTYRRLFSTAFPRKDRKGIDTLEVMNAIGSYVRSLVALNSRFDAYMRGDRMAMTVAELNGFNLFMGKAKCATCHYMPLFNGTFPPRFIRAEAEVIGVPQSLSGNTIDPDMGRFDIVKAGSFRHAFKTPTVRNAARTAPYMHNGVFATLEQVVDFYDKGGGKGLGMEIGNQTLPFDHLALTEKEKGEVIAFMKSLDSR